MSEAQPDERSLEHLAIEAVKNINTQHPNNKNYSASFVTTLRKTTLYKVFFNGDDGQPHHNWVAITGNSIKADYFLDKLLSDRSIGFFPSFFELDYIRLFFVSFLAFVFSVAVIVIAAWQPENNNIQLLSGLAGLTIGYLVGQVGGSKGANAP